MIKLSQHWCIALFMKSLSLKTNWRNVRRSNVMKCFCTGEGWGMLKECVDILKWQWENNEGLLIGGWEPHRDVASHCFQGPHGGRCCQSGGRSAIGPHKTWGELRLVDSGPFACIKIQRRLVAVLISVIIPRSLSRSLSGKYYPPTLLFL